MRKMAIIGYGASTIGFLYNWLKQDMNKIKQYDIDIFDKNTEQCAGGLGGLQYDGKLIVSKSPTIALDYQIQQELLKFFISYINNCENNIKECNNNSDIINQFYQHNMELIEEKVYHVGTEKLKELNQNILKYFKDTIKQYNLNIHFHFNTHIDQNKLNHLQQEYDIVILAVGRYGMNLINYIIQKYPELQESVNGIDLGLRYEIPSNLPNIKRLDNKFYEWKVRYKAKNDLIVRTFCHNPNGFVIVENVDILDDKIAIVNGHSKNIKSENTNFAILVTQKFTEPFNNPILYGKILAQQANLLAGGDSKIIMQTLGNFMNRKRTKYLFRVMPTLSKQHYIMGDLSYVLPAKTYEAIKEFIYQLSQIIPEILYEDNLLYGLEIKFYSNVMKDNNKFKFIGDCSGNSRSIITAAGTGFKLVQKF